MENQMEALWAVGLHSIKESASHKNNTYETLDFKLHPKFYATDVFDDFDIALVTVDRPMVFSASVRPICLPRLNENRMHINEKMTVAGKR